MTATIGLTPTISHADQFDPPAVAGEFTGTAKGKVKWVHQSGNWFMLNVEELSPKAGGAAKFDEVKAFDQGLKVGLVWNGAKPNPQMKAYIATLKPGQSVTVELKPNYQKTGVQLASVPSTTAAPAAPAAAANVGGAMGERGPNLMDIDADKLGDYLKVNRGFKSEKNEGNFAGSRWALGAWDANSQVELKNAEVGGKKAIALTNLEGKPAIMFYRGGLANVKAGETAVAEMEYRTAGNGTLIMEIGGQKQNFALPTSADWKKASFSMKADADGALKVDFRNGALGADNTLYLRPIYVGVASGAGGVAAVAAPVAQPAVAGMTDPGAKDGLNGLYQKVMFSELNALPRLIARRWKRTSTSSPSALSGACGILPICNRRSRSWARCWKTKR